MLRLSIQNFFCLLRMLDKNGGRYSGPDSYPSVHCFGALEIGCKNFVSFLVSDA